MTRAPHALLLCSILTLSACTTVPPPPMGDPLPPATTQCRAEGAQWAIGRAATPDVVERIRVETNSRIARVLRPGQMVTMEFNGERVNITVNERDAITAITCG